MLKATSFRTRISLLEVLQKAPTPLRRLLETIYATTSALATHVTLLRHRPECNQKASTIPNHESAGR